MARLDELIAALAGRKQELVNNNPWIRNGAMLAKQDYYSPSSSNASNLGAALLSGLSSGLMSGYGQNQATTDYANEASALGDALSLKGPEQQAFIDKTPALETYKPILLLNQKREEEQAAKDQEALAKQMMLMDYQQQAKAKYAKPSETKPSNLEKAYNFLVQTEGPQAGKAFLARQSGMPLQASTEATSLEDALKNKVWLSGEDRHGVTKELGKLQNAKQAIAQISTSWGKLRDLALPEALDPTGENWARFEGAILPIFPAMKEIFGQLSRDEKQTMLMFVPHKYDSPEKVDYLTGQMINFLKSKVTTPALYMTLGKETTDKYLPNYLGDPRSPVAATAPETTEIPQSDATGNWIVTVQKGPNGQLIPIKKRRA